MNQTGTLLSKTLVVTGVALLSGLFGTIGTVAQNPSRVAKQVAPQAPPTAPQTPPVVAAPSTGGPRVDSVSPQYKAPPKSDPFFEPGKIRPPFQPPPTELEYPSFAERELKWRQIRDRRLEQGLPAPADSEKYLVDEFIVKGIYSTGRGLGALLTAKQSGITIFVREGSKFWNGSVTKIDRATRTVGLDTQIVGQVVCTEIVVLNNGKIKIKPKVLYYVPKSPR